MLTFYELVVVVLQSRALLSHVCCSTCTQGCTGWAVAAMITLSHLSGWGYRSSSYERTQGGIVRCLCALTPSQQQPTPNTSLARAPAGLEAAHLTLPRNRRAKKRYPLDITPETKALFVCP